MVRKESFNNGWTSEIRKKQVETTVRLLAARLEPPYDPDGMASIIEKADMVVQLGKMYFTLTGRGGESYARKAIGWTLKAAENYGIELESEVMDLAQKYLPAKIG